MLPETSMSVSACAKYGLTVSGYCHSARTIEPPVVVAGTALYVVPTIATVAAVGDAAAVGGALVGGTAVTVAAVGAGVLEAPQALATRAATLRMPKSRLRIVSPP
jgi:hypothetical protein